MTKKIVLIIGLFVILFLLFLAYLQGGTDCYSTPWCGRLWDSINTTGAVLMVFIPVFLFSLITYKMREEVFRAWWNFAIWFVPLIMFVTFLQNYSSHLGGSGISSAVNDSFNYFILGLLYLIFVVVSVFRIASVYRNNKAKTK